MSQSRHRGSEGLPIFLLDSDEEANMGSGLKNGHHHKHDNVTVIDSDNDGRKSSANTTRARRRRAHVKQEADPTQTHLVREAKGDVRAKRMRVFAETQPDSVPPAVIATPARSIFTVAPRASTASSAPRPASPEPSPGPVDATAALVLEYLFATHRSAAAQAMLADGQLGAGLLSQYPQIERLTGFQALLRAWRESDFVSATTFVGNLLAKTRDIQEKETLQRLGLDLCARAVTFPLSTALPCPDLASRRLHTYDLLISCLSNDDPFVREVNAAAKELQQLVVRAVTCNGNGERMRALAARVVLMSADEFMNAVRRMMPVPRLFSLEEIEGQITHTQTAMEQLQRENLKLRTQLESVTAQQRLEQPYVHLPLYHGPSAASTVDQPAMGIPKVADTLNPPPPVDIKQRGRPKSRK